MTTPSPEVYEKLASFYLGRHFDLDRDEMLDELTRDKPYVTVEAVFASHGRS